MRVLLINLLGAVRVGSNLHFHWVLIFISVSHTGRSIHMPLPIRAAQVYSAAIQGILPLILSFKPVQCVHRVEAKLLSILNHPVQYVIVILLHQVVDLPRVVSLIKFIVLKLK